ncbi:hypothetical protein SASPL_135836 [Salvia splendens]|uniref:Solute carrier family 25 (Mitochondrial uncoupling protein), member 8/9 n=1 Tax=Salvia splendens TaxID=180675 RepID=A0A8X8X0H5_SALSN|nr:hypothetical protein SASPL_135836 [Salvia splendens]
MADPLQISFAGIFACSAFAACLAEVESSPIAHVQIYTIPLDTAKVRLQLQKRVPLGDSIAVPKYKGLLGTITTIAKEEGFFALWNGVVPGLHRQCLYGGLRVELYQPVKAFISGTHSADVPLFFKIIAALLTGAIAITVANPTDLVKARLQAEGKLPVGVARWLGPNIARNATVNAAELASYDQVKETILKIPGFTDNVLTHILAGLGAGFFAVCIGSPIDVVKSRMMGDSVYKGTVDCFFKTLKTEGLFAFYKGFLPNFGRLGSWNVIMFLTLEQVRQCIFWTYNFLMEKKVYIKIDTSIIAVFLGLEREQIQYLFPVINAIFHLFCK